jgi:serine/threonine-protein kinase
LLGKWPIGKLGAVIAPFHTGRVTAQLAAQLQDALGPDYRIERELDGGGMSRLFIATDLRHNRRVVVKVLSPELVSTQSAARFKREIELTVRLQHPHILPILTSGAWDDCLYYITPYIAGESLKARIEREGKLPLDDIVKILRDVSGALAFAHQRGIVHRDVKPGNILLAEGHAILADFGIARAVATNATPLTGSGMTPGTPAYMAPELPTDEKADVYALGVVAYEMLTGKLPKRGVTVKDVVDRRGQVLGDDVRRLRSIATVVTSAMETSLELRIATTKDVQASLDALSHKPAPRSAVLGLGVAVVAVAVIGVGIVLTKRAPVAHDSSAYLVVAVDQRDTLARAAARATNEALEGWSDVRTVEPRDSAAGRGLRAANVIRVSASVERDSVIVKATLYDAPRDSLVRTARDGYALASSSESEKPAAFWRLVNAVLREGRDLPSPSRNGGLKPSLRAWRAFDSGVAAVARWDLDGAEAHFREAARAERNLPSAELWLAQVLSWRNAQPDEVRRSAEHSLTAALTRTDSLRAVALLRLASGDYPASCEAFDRLATAEPLSVAAWIGKGDCQARDRTVVQDSRSGTNWIFRGSFEGAARAYIRAADVAGASAPAALHGWLLGRLSAVLYGIPNKMRMGFRVDPDTLTYVAFPFLRGDSLAFQPYLLREARTARLDPAPSEVERAIARNRSLIRRAAEEWVRRDPKSVAALDSLAGWAEVSGGSAVVDGQTVSTMDIVRRARSMSGDPEQIARLSAFVVRLKVKEGDFAGARAEADSLLSGILNRAPKARDVPGVAALVGHISQARIEAPRRVVDPEIALPDGKRVALPSQLLDHTLALAAFASFGVQGDSIEFYAKETLELIGSYFPDTNVANLVRSSNRISVPLTLAFPLGREFLARVSSPPDEVTSAYRSLAMGDSTRLMGHLSAIRRIGSGKLPGASVDANLRRARLWLIARDTVAAIGELDPVLRALPTLSPFIFWEVSQSAALVRALALRADIAFNSGDRVTAAKYAKNVVALWSGGDAAVKPVVDRMNRYLQ